MIDQKMIEEVKKRLVATYDPVAIYIFGSYAWGTPDEESDLDLLVVVNSLKKPRWTAMSDGHRALLGLSISKDILVYSKDEFEERVNQVTSLCNLIMKREKKIY